VKKRIQADIEKKVQGQEIEVSETTEAPAQIIDLMEALKASLGAAKGSKRAAPAAAQAEEEESEEPAKPRAKGGARKAEGKRAARR
jgi:DNA end-binding protein Ku